MHRGQKTHIVLVASVTMMAATLSACASYQPRPVTPAQIIAKRQVLTLDGSAVAQRITEIAPGRATVPGARWDRLSLLAAATIYNPNVVSARAALATASANVGVARQWPNATLTLTTEYANDPAASSPWLFGGALDVPLDLGRRRSLRRTAADLAVLSARYDIAEAIWTARSAIRKALADRLIADRLAVALVALEKVRDRQFAAMDRRVAAGEASRAELERVRADGADVARRLSDAQASLRSADRAIAAAIGVPQPALTDIALEWNGFDDPAPDPAPGVSERMRLEAVLSRPDILKAVVAYDQAEADLRGEVAKQFPAISVAPGYVWERGLVKLPFSLGLLLPPLDLNRHAIAAAEARRSEAGSRLEAVVFGAEAAIDAALVETSAARAALARIRGTELAAADRLAAQADRELAAGAIDRTEWAAAQAGARQARTSEIDALARVHAADAALEDALRRPVEGPETMVRMDDMGQKP